jgi:hypothetical protein
MPGWRGQASWVYELVVPMVIPVGRTIHIEASRSPVGTLDALQAALAVAPGLRLGHAEW